MTATKRTSGKRPGFDCREQCLHEKKGKHGISGGEWRYSVSEGDRAVSLCVLASDYPETVARPLPSVIETPTLATLHWHEADANGDPCDLVTGGRCKSDVSDLDGGALWKEHGDPGQFEQGDMFWLSLEARLLDLG